MNQDYVGIKDFNILDSICFDTNWKYESWFLKFMKGEKVIIILRLKVQFFTNNIFFD